MYSSARATCPEPTRNLRESLRYDTAQPLERMLIEHACVCWFRLTVMYEKFSDRLVEKPL